MENSDAVKIQKEALQEIFEDCIYYNYPPDEEINDLQTIEYSLNEISLRTTAKSDEKRLSCFKSAKRILEGGATVEGLTLKMTNGNVRQYYQKIIRAYMRIIWKKECEDILQGALESLDKTQTQEDMLKTEEMLKFPEFPTDKL